MQSRSHDQRVGIAIPSCTIVSSVICSRNMFSMLFHYHGSMTAMIYFDGCSFGRLAITMAVLDKFDHGVFWDYNFSFEESNMIQ